MRSMWKGAISFGLVMIPVRLYAATEQKDISFRQVHREDGGRIRFRRFCSLDEQEIPYEEIAKGYELPTGEMVVLTDEDMSDLPLPTTKAIEVLQFAPAAQVDPMLFNRSYYVEPETAGARAYVLLRNALEQSGRVAVAQVALRQRESLATLRVKDGVLVLETLLWPDEIRPAEFPFLEQDVEVRPQELTMAASLIDSMTADFDSDAFHDNYREALIELVEAKVEGRELLQPGTLEIAASPAASLTDALRASLEAQRGGQGDKRAIAAGREDGRDSGSDAGRDSGSDADEDEDEGAGSASKSGAAKASSSRASSSKTSSSRASSSRASSSRSSSAKAGSSGGAGSGEGGSGKSSSGRSSSGKAGGSRTTSKSRTTRKAS
ncbi:MAG TPA: Ku protein [Streptosporangiaceae bacterium]|nr:Ku protein [Streptosporangiaceae bacterium]